MQRRTVLVSYLMLAGSAAYLTISANPPPYNLPPGTFFLNPVLNIVPVAGLILAPYFAIAGLISKNESVWKEVNRMLHTHISFPIVGGIVILYGSSIGSGSGFFGLVVLPVYLVFVFLATLISVMAARTSKPTPTPTAQ